MRMLFQAFCPFLFIAAAALLPVVFVIGFTACHLGTWMLVSDSPPSTLDYIFTFGGERAREVYAAEMMKRYPDALWLCSSNRKQQKAMLASCYGMDTSRVVVVDTCSNTHSEAQFLAAWLGDRPKSIGASSPVCVGLISGPYHMRRISLEIRWHAAGADARFCLLPVPLDFYKSTREAYRLWWTDAHLRYLLPFEVRKMVKAAFQHHAQFMKKG
jgi:uncharacterized SAM-binding protein YcdF (DUF218 family)